MTEDNVKLNRDYLGRKYTSGPHLVDAESIRKYAHATNERNPLYLDEREAVELIASPLYPVVFIPMLLDQLVEEAEAMGLDILRVVHAEQEMLWRDVLRPGDTIHASAEIADMQSLGVNELLGIEIICSRNDNRIVEMQYRLMLRGRGKVKKKVQKPSDVSERGEMIAEQKVRVTEDQGLRYAEASGDHNPIHTSDEVARFAGLPRSILQGLCTMAFASQAIVDEILNGDPSRLKKMKVRFSKPVFMGQDLTTKVYASGVGNEGHNIVQFETADSEGVPVLTRGWAEYV
ncbi:MAG: MaoC/PaaZ C-terminal domain-containing protein [Candidatus Thorarchaeota archaeon]